ERDPDGGLSNRPKANIWVRIRATAALTVAWFSVPADRAADTSLALENGIAMSMPPTRSATALPAAPQSETTKPPELACSSSPSCSMSALAHEESPLTTAYEHMNDAGADCSVADSNGARYSSSRAFWLTVSLLLPFG